MRVLGVLFALLISLSIFGPTAWAGCAEAFSSSATPFEFISFKFSGGESKITLVTIQDPWQFESFQNRLTDDVLFFDSKGGLRKAASGEEIKDWSPLFSLAGSIAEPTTALVLMSPHLNSQKMGLSQLVNFLVEPLYSESHEAITQPTPSVKNPIASREYVVVVPPSEFGEVRSRFEDEIAQPRFHHSNGGRTHHLESAKTEPSDLDRLLNRLFTQ